MGERSAYPVESHTCSIGWPREEFPWRGTVGWLMGLCPVREINGTLVDEEFGLYDNRMRAGDEAVWIAKYRRAFIVTESA